MKSVLNLINLTKTVLFIILNEIDGKLGTSKKPERKELTLVVILAWPGRFLAKLGENNYNVVYVTLRLATTSVGVSCNHRWYLHLANELPKRFSYVHLMPDFLSIIYRIHRLPPRSISLNLHFNGLISNGRVSPPPARGEGPRKLAKTRS